MRCKICGAKLKKEGDICKSCYAEYCKEEALEKDTKEIFKLHRKYIPIYQMTRYLDWFVIAIIIFIVGMAQGSVGYSLLFALVAFLILLVALYCEKRIAINTKCIFYEKKIVHDYKGRKKTIAYSDLKNVTYYQTFFQKLFKLGDIQFHPENGTYLLSGFEIKNVPDIENNWEKVQEILQSKKEV